MEATVDSCAQKGELDLVTIAPKPLMACHNFEESWAKQ